MEKEFLALIWCGHLFPMVIPIGKAPLSVLPIMGSQRVMQMQIILSARKIRDVGECQSSHIHVGKKEERRVFYSTGCTAS